MSTVKDKPPTTQSTPDTRNVSLKVNGREVTVPRTTPDPITGKPLATTMIQACASIGVEVPHYCYHEKLPVAGNCRMCLVEFGTPAVGPDRKPLKNPDGSPVIRKSPRPAIACATPVSPGMEIYTESEGVRAMREAVLEFLLINHPLDCPICDQAGECKLQEYALDHGRAESQFEEVKVHKPKAVDLGPRILLDAERCILCSRCVRFTRDIAGDDALGIVNRGGYNTIAAYPGRRFDNNYTLNTADICPVGALTSKDFRFRMRVWFLKETKTLCTSCGTGCNVFVGSRQGRVYRYTPRQNDAVNSCWMCDAGRLNYRWIGREDRLQAPVSRRSHARTWPAVIRETAEILKVAEPGSVAIVASARQTNEELYLLKKLANHLKARSDALPREDEGDDLLVSEDRNPNSTGARLLGVCYTEMGINLPYIVQDIEAGSVRTLVVFGEDLTKPEWALPEGLLDKLDCLIVSDILPNGTTERADLLLPGCAHVEKRGSFINVNGRVQRFAKAVEPPGEARPEVEFLLELVKQVTGESLPETMEGLYNRLREETPALSGTTWAGLGDQGATVSV